MNALKPNRTACGYSKAVDRRKGRWVLKCLLTGEVCDRGYSNTRETCELGTAERERWNQGGCHDPR